VEASLPRYRCRVGHAYATDAIVENQSNAVDQALRTALRALLAAFTALLNQCPF